MKKGWSEQEGLWAWRRERGGCGGDEQFVKLSETNSFVCVIAFSFSFFFYTAHTQRLCNHTCTSVTQLQTSALHWQRSFFLDFLTAALVLSVIVVFLWKFNLQMITLPAAKTSWVPEVCCLNFIGVFFIMRPDKSIAKQNIILEPCPALHIKN